MFSGRIVLQAATGYYQNNFRFFILVGMGILLCFYCFCGILFAHFFVELF